MGYDLPSLRLCNLFILFCCLLWILIINPSSSSSSGADASAGAEAAGQPPTTTELVRSICNNTTNYTFCVESLYSDPRTPTADAYILAYVSFDLAYVNATHTIAYIKGLLPLTTTTTTTTTASPGNSSRDPQLLLLKRCDHWYREAVSALAQALNDLDSETYSELSPSAAVAARKACDCQAAFQATHSPSPALYPLSRMNHHLKGLSNICIVVSRLFTSTVNDP